MHTPQITRLKPEDRRALGVLAITLKEHGTIPRSNMSKDVWIHNKITSFYAPLTTKSIPSGKDWRWNQTRAKKVASLESFGASVTFAKLITRKTRSGVESIPNYKLWHFTLTFAGQLDSIVILWCEKGKIENSNNDGTMQITHNTISPNLSESEDNQHKLLLSFICN